MLENNNKKRVTLSIIGLILCGIGVSLSLTSDLGVDPNSVFVTGVANQLNTSYGVSSLIINGSILLAVYFIDKTYVNISSILGIFIIGFSVDSALVIYNVLGFVSVNNIVLQIILLLLGLIIMSIGIVTYINQDLGIAAFDSISEIISRKYKLDYKYVRISIDNMLMIIGWLLGGVIGLGSIVIAILTGPSIKFIRNKMKYNNL